MSVECLVIISLTIEHLGLFLNSILLAWVCARLVEINWDSWHLRTIPPGVTSFPTSHATCKCYLPSFLKIMFSGPMLVTESMRLKTFMWICFQIEVERKNSIHLKS